MQYFTKLIWGSVLALVIAAFLMTKISITSSLAPLSGIIIILMALPSFIALYYWIGMKRAVLLLIVLGLYAVIIETFAIITSFPYSAFRYSDLIGYKLFGYTPYTVPFAYIPLLLGSFYLATRITHRRSLIIILTTSLMLLVDMVLDPAALALKFWTYETSGIFYGVPGMNFIGWLLTGFIAACITLIVIKEKIKNPPPAALVASLLLILVFWGSISIYLGLVIPGLIAFILLILIIWKTKGKIGQLF